MAVLSVQGTGCAEADSGLDMQNILKNGMASLEEPLARILRCGILPQGTYLAGGTAVYFYLRHRISVDLDFFTPEAFSSEFFLHSIRECFDEITVELLGRDTVIFYLGPEKLKFSLFHFPYRLLSQAYEMQIQEGAICTLASLNDIIAMKAVAINQRGSIKDFIDLFFMLRKTNLDFDRLANLVTDKYDLNHSYDYQLKTSFVYFDDAEGEVDQIIMLKNNEPRRMTHVEWENIKIFYQDFVK
ncbi:MAG TPA: nucleotidyl transferase AbiEii/AbiGii toxin family protein [Desulfobacteraceae bacterium]|nr:nucleotidyl transferase AbiEii/AbiGii toxin family protein [Desulfobacteraceae bacterium]